MKNTFTKCNRAQKDIFRMEVMGTSRPHGSLFLLPYKTCLDVQEGIRQKTVNPRTDKFILCERHKRTILPMMKTLKKLHVKTANYAIFCGPLQRVNLHLLREKISAPPISLFWPDVCGTLTDQIATWLANLDGKDFKKGAILVGTFDVHSQAVHKTGILQTANSLPEKLSGHVFDLWCKRGQDQVGECRENSLLVLYILWAAITRRFNVELELARTYTDRKHTMLGVIMRVRAIRDRNNAVNRTLIPEPRIKSKKEQPIKDCDLLQCKKYGIVSAGIQAGITRKAHRGIKPNHLSDYQWNKIKEQIVQI